MMVDEWGQKSLKEKGGIEGTGRRGGRTGKKEAKERNRGTARNRPGGQKGEKRLWGRGDLLATASFLPRAVVHRRKSLEG